MHGIEPAPEAAQPIVLRRCTPADVPEVLRLVAACPESPSWPPAAWAHSLQADGAMSLAALARDGRSFAGILLAVGVLEVTELELLLVAPGERGRGVGKALLCEWLECARRDGAESAQLEVRSANGIARKLYERHGFVAGAVRRGYYSQPPDDALLMQKSLMTAAKSCEEQQL